MVTIDGPPDRKPIWCDPCIAPVVKALNDAGLRTIASCCGHGRRPGNIVLEDGRELFIARDFNAGRQMDILHGCDDDPSGIGRATEIAAYAA